MWALMTEEVVISVGAFMTQTTPHVLSEGLLTGGAFPIGEILSLQDATNWVLELMQIYLTSGITPAGKQGSRAFYEKWRQTLTLQNQSCSSSFVRTGSSSRSRLKR